MSELRVDRIVNSSGSGAVEFTQGISVPSGQTLSGIAQTAQSLTANASINTTGIITASSLVKSGGTSSQFLKADGSVDSNTYLTSETFTSLGIQSGGVSIGNATALNFIGVGNTFAVNGSTIDISIQGGGGSYWSQTAAGIHALSNVGVGTTNPNASLHVVDDVLVSAGAAATLDVRIKTYSNENGSISFENAVDATSIFTLQQGDSDILFDVSTSPTNQVFQVGVDRSIIISSGVSTEDFKIKAYTDELGSLSFEDPVDGTQYFSITQDLSTLLFGVNDANLNTVFVVDPNGNVGVKTDSIGASRALDVYGNAVISGSITKGSGTFTIPHPIDSSKLLVHSFIEGPRADLIYRGKSQLSNGISTVMMDSCIGIITGTWKALCRNPQVFLQNNESFALVKATITDDGILTITSNEDTNDTIDWMVVAERQDEVIKNANWTDDDGNPILEPTK